MSVIQTQNGLLNYMLSSYLGKTRNKYDSKLNYHDEKIWQTLASNTQKHWTAFSTLLGLISSVYCDLTHWRSNQRLQNAEPKLDH